MEVVFTARAIADYEYWKSINNIQIQERISQLINSINDNPYSGLGKPEPLKHNLSGYWSRRINQEHRLVYRIKNGEIHIISLKGHY